MKLLLSLIALLTALVGLGTLIYKNMSPKDTSEVKIENSTINKNESTNIIIKDSIIQNGNGNSVLKNAK